MTEKQQQSPVLGPVDSQPDVEKAKTEASEHVEMLRGMSPEDAAFLTSFTEAQRKKVLRKVLLSTVAVVVVVDGY